jgi:predicted GNAT family acetyltransferase
MWELPHWEQGTSSYSTALGKLEELENEDERKTLADRIEQLLTGGKEIFPVDIPSHVEKLAVHLSRQIRQKGLLSKSIEKPVKEVSEEPSDVQSVDLASLELEDVPVR